MTEEERKKVRKRRRERGREHCNNVWPWSASRVLPLKKPTGMWGMLHEKKKGRSRREGEKQRRRMWGKKLRRREGGREKEREGQEDEEIWGEGDRGKDLLSLAGWVNTRTKEIKIKQRKNIWQETWAICVFLFLCMQMFMRVCVCTYLHVCLQKSRRVWSAADSHLTHAFLGPLTQWMWTYIYARFRRSLEAVRRFSWDARRQRPCTLKSCVTLLLHGG